MTESLHRVALHLTGCMQDERTLQGSALRHRIGLR
jgi:hypothetical protein